MLPPGGAGSLFMPFDRELLNRRTRTVKDMDLSIKEMPKLDRMDDGFDEAAVTDWIGQDAFACEFKTFCEGDWTDLECKCGHVFMRTCSPHDCNSLFSHIIRAELIIRRPRAAPSGMDLQTGLRAFILSGSC